MTREALNQEIMKAHDLNDSASLGVLYLKAGKVFISDGDIDHGCFLLTAAYVFSLEAGILQAKEAKDILVNYGREE
ncbi:MAG: hypothetical protein CML34_04515 [Rhodobacteraceae bacterium]|jgi:hypothetical protein|nr:hypothetical protein [Paracoccaceae bacterium]MDG1940033.1 hypothetical protein [Paracoccaceae bacterium]|tara:strand:+ start:9 stop:236 length:228 start_codon:yes stop_codon:yes gene_type:complete